MNHKAVNSRAEALKVLGLTEDDGEERVRAAFLKLARRYPSDHFPEKFVRIHAAYDLLKPKSNGFAHILLGKAVDLSCLSSNVKATAVRETLTPKSDREFLNSFVRQAILDRCLIEKG